jgi:hypothetical protein
MDLNVLKSQLVSRAHRGGALMHKHSPDIFLGLGITGLVGAGVLACRATLRATKIKEEMEQQLTNIESLLADEKIEGPEAVQAQTYIALTGVVDIGREYVIPVGLGAASIAAILQSRNILTTRNAGMAAAYKLADETYKRYRGRVLEEFGEEVDAILRSDIDETRELRVKMVDGDEERDLQLTDEEMRLVEFGMSPYAKFFDSSSPQWRNTPEQNMFFLRAQQTNMNVQLRVRGHVFLNEVYDALGIPRTSAGAVVGWVDGQGDSVIDFGVFDEANADFVNGYETEAILLDFNVDGTIWDNI